MTEIIQPIFQTAAWVVIYAFVPSFIVMNAVLIAGAFLTYVERKVIGHIQLRPGPNRVGPLGLLQPLADGIKLLTKEDIIPAQADRFVFVIAPFLSLVPVIMAYAVIPWGEPTTIMGLLPWLRTFDGWGYIPPEWNPFPLVPEKATLVISNLNIGVLYILAMSGLSAYGIILAGWGSNSKYALLGGLRSAAQVISYEIAMGLAIVGTLMLAGSLSLVDIVRAQESSFWFVLAQPLGFLIFFISGIAETNRAPFDLPEAESEIVAGFHTEYSGMRFAFFFMAEYGAMVIISAMASILYLGGWLPLQLPIPSALPAVGSALAGADGAVRAVNAALMAIPPIVWMLSKIGFFLFVYIWLRATFPRLRYDQLMHLGWKVMLPLGLANIFVTGLVILVKG